MAIITPSTFDPLRRYVAVRLQQGVPIVDADWNELDDALAFELRAFRRWFVGDGVPAGGDAFRVVGTGAANDVTISKGAPDAPALTSSLDKALRYAGHCSLDGWDVFITDDIGFVAQPLHESHGAAADAESARLGVPKIAALVTSVMFAATATVYLDAWERLVRPGEDPALVLPALGTESCARTKRECVVRTRREVAVPKPGDVDFLPGHAYFALAHVLRPVGQAAVNAADVTDARQTRLTLADSVQRVTLLERLTAVPAFAAGTQLNPKIGPVGQLVHLHGRHFTVGTPTVTFGNVIATVVPASVTDTAMDVTVPAGVTNNSHVTVANEIGSVTSDETFIIQLPPELAPPPNEFSPSMGPPTSSVTVHGKRFDVANLRVTMNTVDAAIVASSESAVTITVPRDIANAAVGPYTITVHTAAGSVTSRSVFTLGP